MNSKMKQSLHNSMSWLGKLSCALMVIALVTIFITSCNDDEVQKTLPVVSLVTSANITTTSADLGAEITDTGNAKITESGFVYSNVVPNPTISEEKLEVEPVEGMLNATLAELNSGTTYYVRAYAVNSEGIAYSETHLEVSTGNAAPTAIDVIINGVTKVGENLTAAYTYVDPEGDVQGETVIQWYRSDDLAGTNESAIEGATAASYRTVEADNDKFISVAVTPIAATGTNPGLQVKSIRLEVGDAPTSVTWIYNHNTVTYGIIISPTTGRRWLDRNLGAPNVASSSSDFANAGDVFQWGRGDDGHQVVTRTGYATCCPELQITGVESIGTLIPDAPQFSSTDNPGHSLFIVMNQNAPNSPHDWRRPQNNNLWQTADDQNNNPCPEGFRIPTKDEWAAELTTGGWSNHYARLKLTRNPMRRYQLDSSMGQSWSGWDEESGADGYYWTSTTFSYFDSSTGFTGQYSYVLRLTGFSGGVVWPDPSTNGDRAYARACRCIKD